jgi:hypothetical protein
MAKKKTGKPRRPAQPRAGKATKKAANPSDEDILADIVILRGLVQRLGAARVIHLVKHFE